MYTLNDMICIYATKDLKTTEFFVSVFRALGSAQDHVGLQTQHLARRRAEPGGQTMDRKWDMNGETDYGTWVRVCFFMGGS